MNLPLKKGGLKIQGSPDKGQVTLKASFEAGKLIADAKKLKRKILMGQDAIEVSFMKKFWEVLKLGFWGRNQSELEDTVSTGNLGF